MVKPLTVTVNLSFQKLGINFNELLMITKFSKDGAEMAPLNKNMETKNINEIDISDKGCFVKINGNIISFISDVATGTSITQPMKKALAFFNLHNINPPSFELGATVLYDEFAQDFTNVSVTKKLLKSNKLKDLVGTRLVLLYKKDNVSISYDIDTGAVSDNRTNELKEGLITFIKVTHTPNKIDSIEALSNIDSFYSSRLEKLNDIISELKCGKKS